MAAAEGERNDQCINWERYTERTLGESGKFEFDLVQDGQGLIDVLARFGQGFLDNLARSQDWGPGF